MCWLNSCYGAIVNVLPGSHFLPLENGEATNSLLIGGKKNVVMRRKLLTGAHHQINVPVLLGRGAASWGAAGSGRQKEE